MTRTTGIVILLLALMSGQAWAQEARAPYDDPDRQTCASFPELCGAGVVWGPDYAGVDNCTADPNCLTRRIVHRGSGASDFIAVPDATDPDATDPDDPDGPAPANPAGPRCTPRAAGRIAPDLAQTALPTGEIGVNPHFEQLTGLESWLWWQGQPTTTWDSPVAVGINADCSTVPAPTAEPYHATLVTLHWHIDDGRPATYTSDHHGSEEHPAVRHTWQTKGRWTVTVTCTGKATGARPPPPTAATAPSTSSRCAPASATDRRSAVRDAPGRRVHRGTPPGNDE